MRRHLALTVALATATVSLSACGAGESPSPHASSTVAGVERSQSPLPSDGMSPSDPDIVDPTYHPDDGTGPIGAPTKAPTTAVLTSAAVSESDGVVSLAGYIDGVIADGGTCRYTLTQATRSVTADVTGVADASTTQCPWADVTTSKLSSGEWMATVTYLPTGAVSDPLSFSIP